MERSPLLRRSGATTTTTASSNSSSQTRTRPTRSGSRPAEPQHLMHTSIDQQEEDNDRYHTNKNTYAYSILSGLQRILNRSGTAIQRIFPPNKREDEMSATHYEDRHNDESWNCTFGTTEDDGIWMNHVDRAGTIMSLMVYVLIVYASVTILLLAQHQHVPKFVAGFYITVCALAMASHAKTTFTDPGAVPSVAVPIHTKNVNFHAMCSQCQSYKPKTSHHCRICNRCISRMDHHCPWMNNCVGANNMKHFILFLIYTWTGSLLALILFIIHYFFCRVCEFTMLERQLVRAMTFICCGSFLFTTSMILNVTYAIMTGVGTIDRLKMKANDTWQDYGPEQPTPLTEIFGTAPLWYVPSTLCW